MSSSQLLTKLDSIISAVENVNYVRTNCAKLADEKGQEKEKDSIKGDYSATKDELAKVGGNPLCPFRRGLDDISKDNKTVNGDEVEWKNDRPNYAKANLIYLKTKLNNWKAGSLEEVVSNLGMSFSFLFLFFLYLIFEQLKYIYIIYN